MRFDTLKAGLILGLLAPVLGFFGYGLIYVTAIRPNHDMSWFINDLFIGTPQYRTQIVTLSLIADAFLFFWFDRREMHRAMRGVIAAMFVYGLYIAPTIIIEQLNEHGWL